MKLLADLPGSVIAGAAVLVAMMVRVDAYVGISNVFAVTWPDQAGLMYAGLFLRDRDAGFKYAAWNAGIISYFHRSCW